MSDIAEILCLNYEESSLQEFFDRMTGLGFKLKSLPAIDAIDISEVPENPKLISIEIKGSAWPDAMEEKIQQLKKLCSQAKIIVILTEHCALSETEALSMGANEVYHYPFDEEFLIGEFFESVPLEIDAANLSLDLMVHVNILDLSPNKKLAFDVYIILPNNKKIILYLKKDTELEQKTFDKFKTHRDFKLYIKRTDAKVYYKESANVLSKIQENGALSVSEKLETTQTEVRKLMGCFFDSEPNDDNENRQIMENARRVLANLEDESGSKAKLNETAIELAGENMTNYTHAKNVGTYCAMFGLILGINEPESLYLGGFLHDIGMADLPSHLLRQNEEDMDEDELAQFKLHPGNGRLAISEKHAEFSDEIINMISHHHEYPDGSGFPYGLKGDEISKYAKICAFADELDRLTSVRMGYKTLSPKEAMESLAGLDEHTAHPCYDIQLHLPIITELLNASDSAEAAAESKNNLSGDKSLNENIASSTGPVEDVSLETVIVKAANAEAEDATMLVSQASDSGENTEGVTADDINKDSLDTKFRDEKGLTILMKLAGTATAEVIASLIEQGADAAAKDFEGVTALMYAIRDDNLPAVEIMINNGAQIKAIDKAGRYTLIHALEAKAIKSAMHLLELEADPNVRYKGTTALMYGSKIGDLELVKKIIAKGGKLGLKDRKGNTAVSYAAKGKHTNVVEYFKTIISSMAANPTKKAS